MMTTTDSAASTTDTVSTATPAMASTDYKGNKSPPTLQKSKSYDDWVKKLKIWRKITCLPNESQGGAILMTLEGEAEDAVLELSEEELTGEDSLDKIVTRLDALFKKNETLEKFELMDSFQTYCRPHHVTINDFIIEFDKRLNKIKKIGTIHSDDFLAYGMIKMLIYQCKMKGW